jgi:hypothetical protein
MKKEQWFPTIVGIGLIAMAIILYFRQRAFNTTNNPYLLDIGFILLGVGLIIPITPETKVPRTIVLLMCAAVMILSYFQVH